MVTQQSAAGLSPEQLAELLNLARRADGRLAVVERDLRLSEELRLRQERWKWPARLVGVVIGFGASILTNQIASASWATEIYRQGETTVLGMVAAANDTRTVWLPWVTGLFGIGFAVLFVIAVVVNFRSPHRRTTRSYRASEPEDDGELIEAGFTGRIPKVEVRNDAPPPVAYSRRSQGQFERELQAILEGEAR